MNRRIQRLVANGIIATVLTPTVLAPGALGLSLIVGPSVAAAETLSEALAQAYANNSMLAAARAELRRTDELVPEALSGWRPQADVTTGGGYVFSGGGSGGASNVTQSSGPAVALDLRVKQPIYNFVTPATVRQAKSAVRAQRARLTAVEQDTLLHTATAYLDVLRAESVLQLTGDQQRQLDRDLQSAQRRFALGELKNSDIAQSEAGVARARAMRTQAEGSLQSARAALSALTGSAPDALTMPVMPDDLPATEAEAADASVNSPNVIAADFALRAAEDGVDVSFGQELPQAYVQADAGASTQSILGLVSFPLYHGGMLDAQVRAAKQLVGQRQREADGQRRQAKQAAITAWALLQSGRANEESYQAQVKATQVAADGIGREGGLGLRTMTDVLLSRQQVLEAQVESLGAQRDALVGAYQLLAAVGRLTANDLNLDVQKYDPTAHYNDVSQLWGGRDIGDDK
ncbi:MAG: TolC family outer membrane protein [Rhodospirillales bacterium]|nr:TolC family outer membrane protein [Rhodospirillales bacterium]